MKTILLLIFNVVSTILDVVQLASILLDTFVNLHRLGSVVHIQLPETIAIIILYATEYAEVWLLLHPLVIAPFVVLFFLPTAREVQVGWAWPRFKLGILYILVLVPFIYYLVVVNLGSLEEWYTANLFLVLIISIIISPLSAALAYGAVKGILTERGIPCWPLGTGAILHWIMTASVATLSSWYFLGFVHAIHKQFVNTTIVHATWGVLFYLLFTSIEYVLQWRLGTWQ